MGPTQKAVLDRLAEIRKNSDRPDLRGTVSFIATHLEKSPVAVHSAAVRLVESGLAERRFIRGKYRYTLTPLGERMSEGIGEDS